MRNTGCCSSFSQVKSLVSELGRLRGQMETMQRKLDSLPDLPVNSLASSSTRRDPHSASTFPLGPDRNGRDQLFRAEVCVPSRRIPKGSEVFVSDNSCLPEPREHDGFEDDPLEELATMAPLRKMVTDAETVPRSISMRHGSYQVSPLSIASEGGKSSSHPVDDDTARLPDDPINMGILSEARGRILLET